MFSDVFRSSFVPQCVDETTVSLRSETAEPTWWRIPCARPTSTPRPRRRNSVPYQAHITYVTSILKNVCN